MKGKHKMKEKILNILRQVGNSFMLPIAILPVAGLLLGIGGSFTNTTIPSKRPATGRIAMGSIKELPTCRRILRTFSFILCFHFIFY